MADITPHLSRRWEERTRTRKWRKDAESLKPDVSARLPAQTLRLAVRVCLRAAPLLANNTKTELLVECVSLLTRSYLKLQSPFWRSDAKRRQQTLFVWIYADLNFHSHHVWGSSGPGLHPEEGAWGSEGSDHRSLLGRQLVRHLPPEHGLLSRLPGAAHPAARWLRLVPLRQKPRHGSQPQQVKLTPHTDSVSSKHSCRIIWLRCVPLLATRRNEVSAACCSLTGRVSKVWQLPNIDVKKTC